MPIALTTEYNPGDHDPGNTYPRAKIVSLGIEVLEQLVRVTVSFGDVTDDVWIPGPGARNRQFVIKDDPAATPPTTGFTDLMAALTNDGENVYDAVKRIIYADLQTSHAELAGTIE